MVYSVNTSNRVTGLASGIDTESMVKELMAAERLPLDKMEQDKTWMTWQRDAFRGVNKLFYDLDQKILDMKFSSTYNSKSVSSSNESLVTVSATASASNVAHTIENVTVATAATNRSFIGTEQGISGPTKIDSSKSLWLNKDKFGTSDFWETKTYTNKDMAVAKDGTKFKLEKGALNATFLDGKSIEVEDEDGKPSPYNIVTDADTELNENDVFVNVDSGELTFGSILTKGSTIKGQDYEHNYISFAITSHDQNGNPMEGDFRFDGTTSLNEIMTKISNSNVGVSAFYDSYTDKVSFQRKQTGDLNADGAGMQFTGTFLTDVLGMNSDNEVKGKDAEFTIDGLETRRHSNTFSISNVTYTLNGNFEDSKVTVGVQNNVEQSVEKIMEFVNQYNELIEKVNGSLQEDRYRDYKPLTTAQRKDMSDNEIELWEERAKSGLLKGESMLSSSLFDMRQNWYATVDNESTYSHLSEIGIKTSSDYLDRGKLEVNEEDLKKALQKDPESVHKLFSNNVEGSGRGIINRLEDSISAAMRKIEERAGKTSSTLQQYTIGKRLNDLDDRIDSFEDRLVKIENRHWRQFTEMEKMIQQMNQQSAYLMNQFG